MHADDRQTASTASPSCQLIDSSSTLAPMIRKTDEMIVATACETNIFTRVDVGRQVRQQLGGRELLDVA